MPMYEYRCAVCSTEFEELVSAGTRDDQIACPACGAQQAGRKLSVFAVGVTTRAALDGACDVPAAAPPTTTCGRGTCGLPDCG